MHFTSIVALLPALAMAQEQIPLADRVQGWFNKAKSYVPTAAPVVAPMEKMADKVTQSRVTTVEMSNWQSILAPGPKEQDWFIFVTGGNKTCFGHCERSAKAFNESVLLFTPDPTSPNLGLLDCEAHPILCSIWSAAPPSVQHFQVPKEQADGERAPTPLHIVFLNDTTVTPEEIYKIHSKKTWKVAKSYDGPFHPTDGWLAKYNLNVPLGYAVYGLGIIPSWLFMIVISFFSRTMMSRRAQQQQQRNPAPAAGGTN